jgi:hypothetical protein
MFSALAAEMSTVSPRCRLGSGRGDIGDEVWRAEKLEEVELFRLKRLLHRGGNRSNAADGQRSEIDRSSRGRFSEGAGRRACLQE